MRRKVIVALLIGAGAVYYIAQHTNNTEIIPIEGGLHIYESIDYCQISQKFVIVRAPSNLYALKQIIEKYDRANPLEGKDLPEVKRAERHRDGKRIRYVRAFYRESRDTPRDWDGKPDPDREGRDAEHMQDRIAAIIWDGGDPMKEYDCYDLDRGGPNDETGVFFYRDGGIEDTRNADEDSEWIFETVGDGKRFKRRFEGSGFNHYGWSIRPIQ